MKKIVFVLLVIVLTGALCSCFFDYNEYGSRVDSARVTEMKENPNLYPVYNRISEEEKEVYVKILTAFENFDDSISNVYRADSQREIENFISDTLSIYLYREIAYEHPELFWYDPYNFESSITVIGNKEYILNIKPVYLYNKEQVEEMDVKFQEKINEIVSVARTKTDTYDRVLYVHDYILDNCVYDNAAIENDDFKSSSVNAYGCLVDNKAICSGYTMAFSTIMKRLGYEVGVEFNSYDGFSIFSDGHVWNYCKLDEDYYYFDLTWDDIDPETEFMYDRFQYYHSYFAINRDELEKAHLVLAPQAQTPDCNGKKYNYFIYNGLNFDTYDYETIRSAILSQEEKNYIELRFDSYSELLSAERNLLTEQKIFEIFPESNSFRYYVSESNLQLYIFMSDEYINQDS